jgi:hypothetical protein
MDTIDLGCGNNKRGLAGAEDLERFDSLRLESLVDIYDKDRHISERAATGTQRGECMVSWCINEKQTGDVYRNFSHRPAQSADCIDGNYRCTYVLGNSANLRAHNRRSTYPVKERGLAMIHMPHDADNRRPYLRVSRHIPSPFFVF